MPTPYLTTRSYLPVATVLSGVLSRIRVRRPTIIDFVFEDLKVGGAQLDLESLGLLNFCLTRFRHVD